MDHQVCDTNSKTLKCEKAEVTVFYSSGGPALQECMIRVLHSHITEKPKI